MLSAPNGQMTVNIDTAGFAKPVKKPYVTVWKGTNLAELSFYAENRIPQTNHVDPYAFLNNFTFAVKKDTTYFMRLIPPKRKANIRLRALFVRTPPTTISGRRWRSRWPPSNMTMASAIPIPFTQTIMGLPRKPENLSIYSERSGSRFKRPLQVIWISPSATRLVARPARTPRPGSSPGRMERRLSDN
jgi:hypothetical protein